MSEIKDCFAIRTDCCNAVTFITCLTADQWDPETFREIAEILEDGGKAEYMTTEQFRSSPLGCKCKSEKCGTDTASESTPQATIPPKDSR